MKAAQVATAVLIGVVLVCGTILLLDGQTLSGWIIEGFGLLGFISLLGMVVSDRTERR